MSKSLSVFLILIMAMQASLCLAQQSESFGQYEVHYNVINSDLLPAQVATAYDIRRSSNRALLNITVMDTSQSEYGSPVKAKVATNTSNLTGQRRTIEMREISEPDDAIYYIGELPIHNMETFMFTVTIQVEGVAKPFELKFQHQFYTE
jgi:hypothetical protein